MKSENLPWLLAVDDNERNLYSTKRILEDLDINIQTAGSGEEALQAIVNKDFFLILMDVQMPGMNGFETVSLIKGSKNYQDIPIIFMTAISKEGTYVETGYDKGAVDYLFKPVNPHTLYCKIKVFIELYLYRKELENKNRELEILSKELAETSKGRLRLNEKLEQTNVELEAARKIERHLAYHDNLTQLANRQLFYDRLNHAVKHTNRHRYILALIFLDLDGFKQINDRFGHEVGDLLLQEAAQRLLGCVRESDTVARWGGDEFTIILERINQKFDAEIVAEKIIGEVTKPFLLNEHKLTVSVSIGISYHTEKGCKAEDLVKQADAAMYRVKNNGKNSYQSYDKSMLSEELERKELEGELKKAINNDQLVLHYQPQLNLETNEIVGLEALVRWQHPEHGLVPPGEFIPIAEESGLIIPLGEWVLRAACAQNMTWQKMGFPPIRIAVNLSARQFRVTKLIDTVTEILEESGISSEYLVLEITESSAMENVEKTMQTLRDLKAMGIMVALDDFGTGYASLNYLKRFPIDILKVDRSFINGLRIDNDDWAIICAIVTMAHSLEVTVLAEGIEKQEQFKYLNTLDCDEGQGFYFSRPVPAGSIVEMLQPQPALA